MIVRDTTTTRLRFDKGNKNNVVEFSFCYDHVSPSCRSCTGCGRRRGTGQSASSVHRVNQSARGVHVKNAWIRKANLGCNQTPDMDFDRILNAILEHDPSTRVKSYAKNNTGKVQLADDNHQKTSATHPNSLDRCDHTISKVFSITRVLNPF